MKQILRIVGACVQTGKMARYFGDLELFAMLVACLTHNVGYRGMNYSMIIRFVSRTRTRNSAAAGTLRALRRNVLTVTFDNRAALRYAVGRI